MDNIVNRTPFGQWAIDLAVPVSMCECPCNDGKAFGHGRAFKNPVVLHHEGTTGCWVNREDEATAMSGEVPCRTLCLACVGNKHDYSMLDAVL